MPVAIVPFIFSSWRMREESKNRKNQLINIYIMGECLTAFSNTLRWKHPNLTEAYKLIIPQATSHSADNEELKENST